MKSQRYFGIREKLLVPFLVTVIIVAIMSGGYFYIASQQQLRETVFRELDMTGSFVSSQISTSLNFISDSLVQVASRTAFRRHLLDLHNGIETDLDSSITPILKDAMGTSEWIKDIKIFDPAGSFLVSVRSAPMPEVLSPAFFEQITQNEKAWQFDVDNLLYAQTLTLQNTHIGIMVVSIDTKLLRDLLLSIADRNNAFEIIITHRDASGTLLPLVSSVNSNIAQVDHQFDPFAANSTIIDRRHDYRGKVVLGILQRVQDYPLGITVKLDEEVAMRPVQRQRQTFFTLILVAAILSLIITFIIATYLTRPILNMKGRQP